MPARTLPPKTELERLLRRGMTYQQIADTLSEKLGYKVPTGTVASAIHRAGLAKNRHKKYAREIPWTVKQKHTLHYAARMLRLLGRRNAGTPNSPEQDRRLDSWLQQLEDNQAVVTYLPDTEEGFFYVDAPPGHRDPVPILEEMDGL